MKKILSVNNLKVAFTHFDQSYPVVKGISFDLRLGESLAIVGESGSGKSVTVKSILGLNPVETCHILSGSIEYKGEDLLSLSEPKLRQIRGKEIGMIFQDPMTSLNPTMRIGNQIIESICLHIKNISHKEAKQRALDLLDLVGIHDPESCYIAYPHELSGGMRQRVMIAITLAPKPKILIADEPTTALDVTIQAQILELLYDLQQKLSMSIIFITHDLSLVANFCSKILVMYAGSAVEYSSTKELFQNPKHPYTQRLLRSIPRLDEKGRSPLQTIEGSPPSIFDKTGGCGFSPRCCGAMKICGLRAPMLEPLEDDSETKVACWLYDPRCKVTAHESK